MGDSKRQSRRFSSVLSRFCESSPVAARTRSVVHVLSLFWVGRELLVTEPGPSTFYDLARGNCNETRFSASHRASSQRNRSRSWKQRRARRRCDSRVRQADLCGCRGASVEDGGMGCGAQ